MEHSSSSFTTLLIPLAHGKAPHRREHRRASTTVGCEAFPQLLSALEPGNWPSVVVEDENCTTPSTVDETGHVDVRTAEST
jgi:hypothetical protein